MIAALLRRAKDERDTTPGYITDETRDALNDVGYTAAEIESAINHMEPARAS